MGHSDLVIVSNRGPLSLSYDDSGAIVARRGGGGLVSCLGPAVAGTGATWVAAAMSGAEREAAAAPVEAEGFRLRSLAVDAAAYRQFYDVIANGTLWFLHHGLWDLPRRPRLDRRWREAWDAYREINRAFAQAAAEEAPEGGVVLVQDYQLSLVPAHVGALRPDVAVAYFHHTPFCGPDALRVLPTDVARELLAGVAGARACGFHSTRWAGGFDACAREVLGRSPATFVAPAAAGADELEAVARSDACTRALGQLEEQVGDRRVIMRVDRLEPSKNLLRGFHAFEDLLATHPDWRGRVVFVSHSYPSRESLAEYVAYRQEVEGLAARINDTWGTRSWTPILLDTSDDYPRSVAGLRRYDVLLVNPVRDGLNMVAKEGPLVNERDGTVVLSREAGAWDELREEVLGVNPFDVAETADALHVALSATPDDRARRAAALREVVSRRRPQDWLEAQLRAARRAT